jgi:hypothetical protein
MFGYKPCWTINLLHEGTEVEAASMDSWDALDTMDPAYLG